MARQTKSSDQTLIELFLDMLAAERGAGVNTLSAYRRDLEDLSETLAAKIGIARATTDDLRDYLAALAERGFKASSVARKLSATRQLYRFLYAEGHRRDDPAAVLEGPKRALTLPKVLSIADVDCLLKQAQGDATDPERPAPERLRAMRLACLLEVLYATGLRVSELVALPVSAARQDARMLVVRGKGDKERLVPLNDSAKRAMADYLALALRKDGSCRNQMAVPVLRRERPPHPPAFRARPESARRQGRAETRAGEPACAAPCLRQSSAPQRRGPARGADTAWPRGYFNDPNLHPCIGGTAEKPGPRPASVD